MIENTLVLLFDYLVSTRVGNVIAVFFSVLLFYFIFKLVTRIIDYILFKRLINGILDAIYDIDDEYYDQLPVDREDKIIKKKNRDKNIEAERFKDLENEFIGKNTNKKKQIVGVSKPIGKWTAGIMKQWLKKHQNVDINSINDLGYFQTMMNEKTKGGMDINK